MAARPRVTRAQTSKEYHKTKRNELWVEWVLIDGKSIDEVASWYKVSESTVERVIRAARRNAGVNVIHRRLKSVAPKTDLIRGEYVTLSATLQNPSPLEIAASLNANGTDVSVSQIRRVFKKDFKVVCAVCNANDTRTNRKRMANIDNLIDLIETVFVNGDPTQDVMMFVDESKYSQASLRTRKRVWAPKGERVRLTGQTTSKSVGVNLISFKSPNSVGCNYLVDENMNSDEFAEMVEEVIVWYRELAHRARTPRVNLHLVLDGAHIHSDDKLNDLADIYDEFHFVKLPPYSPDLNLAEFFFSTAKATWRRKHWRVQIKNQDEWRDCVETQVDEVDYDANKTMEYILELAKAVKQNNGNLDAARKSVITPGRRRGH